MHMHLKRLSSTRHGTFGIACGIGVDGEIPLFPTLEPPSVMLQLPIDKEKTCIPAGQYECLRCRISPDYRGDSPNFGNTFQVYDVPGYSLVLWHWGNTVKDTRACILSGMEYGWFTEGKFGIMRSREAHNRFLTMQQTVDRFNLLITEC